MDRSTDIQSRLADLASRIEDWAEGAGQGRHRFAMKTGGKLAIDHPSNGTELLEATGRDETDGLWDDAINDLLSLGRAAEASLLDLKYTALLDRSSQADEAIKKAEEDIDREIKLLREQRENGKISNDFEFEQQFDEMTSTIYQMGIGPHRHELCEEGIRLAENIRAIAVAVESPTEDVEDVEKSGDAPNCFIREGHVWKISYGCESTQLMNCIGLQRIQYLLVRRDEQEAITAIEVANLGKSKPSSHGDADVEDADLTPQASGEDVLDPEYLKSYKRELEDLKDRIDEAKKNNDPETAAKCQEKIYQIVAMVKQAKALGGKSRKFGPTPEKRAFETVRKSLDRAYDLLRNNGLPALAKHLDGSMPKGNKTFVYRPDPHTPDWKLEKN